MMLMLLFHSFSFAGHRELTARRSFTYAAMLFIAGNSLLATCLILGVLRSMVRFTTLPVCSLGLPTATWVADTGRRSSRGLRPKEAATNNRQSAEGDPWAAEAAADTGKWISLDLACISNYPPQTFNIELVLAPAPF